MKKRILVLQMALFLIISCLMLLACGEDSPSPPSSSYPADIIGRVTIANKLVALENDKPTSMLSFYDGGTWWIVDITVKNKEYQLPITDASESMDWSIRQSGQQWAGEGATSFPGPTVTISKGETGNIKKAFAMPPNISPANYQICYNGQTPRSYGALTLASTVVSYDWINNKVITAQPAETTAKTVTGGENNLWQVALNSAKWNGAKVSVNISITNKGTSPANFPYKEVDSNPFGIVLVGEFYVLDQYGQSFPTNSSTEFYSTSIYPGETRKGTLVFEVNARSGETSLYVNYMTTRQWNLFDIGQPQ